MTNAPNPSTNILNDITAYLLHRPLVDTLVKYDSPAARQEYTQRVLQRLQLDVSLCSVFNIHQIGIQAPVRHVFDEIMKWDGDSTCWPNHIAEVQRQRGDIDHMSIFLFGQRQYPFGRKHRFLGLRYIPLFNLTVIRVQQQADTTEADNARYVLFRTTGGYPIGHFCMFARSPIAALGETEMTQVFMMVGFNFYGRKSTWVSRRVSKVWEVVHNRVSANILNRFRHLCERRFNRLEEGP